jgi:hypothetical protein
MLCLGFVGGGFLFELFAEDHTVIAGLVEISDATNLTVTSAAIKAARPFVACLSAGFQNYAFTTLGTDKLFDMRLQCPTQAGPL